MGSQIRRNKRLGVLQRRRDHLQARMDERAGYNDSWDRAELHALDWALNCLRAAMTVDGLIDDLENTPRVPPSVYNGDV